MAWFKVYQETYRHPKLHRLARLLSVPRAAAWGHLACLWGWAMDIRPTGDLSGLTAAEIAEAAGWTEDPIVFLRALIECQGDGYQYGFLEEHDGGRQLLLHEWLKYFGPLLAARERNRKNQEAYRRRQGISPRLRRPVDNVDNLGKLSTKVSHNVSANVSAPEKSMYDDDPMLDRSTPSSSCMSGKNVSDNVSDDVTAYDEDGEDGELPMTPGPEADPAYLIERLGGLGFLDAGEVLERHGSARVAGWLQALSDSHPPPTNPGGWLRACLNGGTEPAPARWTPKRATSPADGPPDKYIRGKYGHLIKH